MISAWNIRQDVRDYPWNPWLTSDWDGVSNRFCGWRTYRLTMQHDEPPYSWQDESLSPEILFAVQPPQSPISLFLPSYPSRLHNAVQKLNCFITAEGSVREIGRAHV